MLAHTLTLLSKEGHGPVSEVLPGPFAARVRGRSELGKRFEMQCVVENLSADYLFLGLECGEDKQLVQTHAKLLIVTGIYRARVALRGVVLGVEQVSEARTRLEIEIRSHRFLHRAEER